MRNLKFNLLVWLTILTGTASAQDCDIFLSFSDFGEGNARTNTVFNGNVGDSGSVFIWVDQNVSIDTGMFLNIKPCNPGSIEITNAEAFDFDISVAGIPIGSRWGGATQGGNTSADCAFVNLSLIHI